EGAAREEPKDVCGPEVAAVPAEETSSFGERLATDVALPSTPLTLFDGMPLPRTVTALPSRESPVRSRSIARCAISPYWSERRGLSLYAGSNTPVHRTIGRAEARSMAGPSARTTNALYAMYWRIVTPVDESRFFIAGVTGPLN